MGIFWEIEQLYRQIEALENRAFYFSEEKEYCETKIKELQKELEQLYNRLKYG